jgi:hypothetical protein
MSPTKSQMRTPGGPLLIVIKPKTKKKNSPSAMLFLIHKKQKPVNKNCIFYQRLLPHTFLGPAISCVTEAPATQVRHVDMRVASCGELFKV